MTSEPRYRLEVTDRRAAERSRARVQLGNRFVFSDGAAKSSGRLARLLGRSGGSGDGSKRVHALTDQPVELDGIRIVPLARASEPLSALVTDRDLYRAEEDTVHLFVALPDVPDDLKLLIELSGEPFSERPLDKREIPSLAEHGVHVEPVSMLLPGDYSAQLAVGDRPIGAKVTFTVASYTLAPLTARLVSHELERAQGRVRFSLAVESYELPYADALRVELLSGAEVVDEGTLEAKAPGRYEGALAISGEGALRLRLIGKDDAERTCEVVIPGSRKREREATVVSELGSEKLLALMPEPSALPLRGAYLSDGDWLGTPVVVEDIVTPRGRLEVKTAVASLTTVTVELATGRAIAKEHGDRAPGDVVELPYAGPSATVFVGGFVDDRPFEGFTTLFRPAALALELDATHDAETRTLLVDVTCGAPGPRPVLLCVRDERLTATDTPEVALSAALKRAIESETANLHPDGGLFDLARDEAWAWLHHGARPIDLDVTAPDEALLATLPLEVVRQLKVAPVSRGATAVVIATSQPGEKVNAWAATAFAGERVEVRYASEASVLRFLERHESAFFFSWPPQVSMGMGLPPGVRASAPVPTSAPPRSYTAAPIGFEDSELDSLPTDLVMSFDEGMSEAALSPADAGGAPAAPPASVQTQALPSSSAAPFRLEHHEKGEAPPAAADPLRASFPEVIFYGLVEVDGAARIELPLADALGTFTVEAFALTGDDWARTKRTVVVDQPVRAELDVPPAVFAGDVVTGTLRAAASGGRVLVTLTRDGQPVALRHDDGALVDGSAPLPSPVELRFRVEPGELVATVTDADSGERDAIAKLVSEPGELKSFAKEVGFLQPGDRLSLADAGDDVLSLRVLPGLEGTTSCLVEATAGYAHLCCEQTAAKVLSATLMYLSATNEKQRSRAEDIILQGIAREKKMHIPGRGLAMYPGDGQPNDFWGKHATRYLWRLEQLRGVKSLSAPLARAVDEGLAIADDAALAYGLTRTPSEIGSSEDAYLVATASPSRVNEALAAVTRFVALDDGDDPRLEKAAGAVQTRLALCYAGAVLLRAGKLREGVRVADVVLRQLNGEGRLYSTCDSVAAIALLGELERSGVGRGTGVVTVNGRRMSTTEAASLADQVESVEVHEGVCVVELSAVRTERWSDFSHGFGVRVGFRGPAGEKKRRFAQGERAELVVELSEGYQVGDLVHLTLPAALACLKGGARVQQLTVDFEGKDEVRVPLLVTGRIEGSQRFALCVRNMFEEERASNPGLLTVEAA